MPMLGAHPVDPQLLAPYTNDTLSKDFLVIRAIEFRAEQKLPKNKRRKAMDFRRSGGVEATAGQVDPVASVGKMANTIDSNKDLQATYLPNQTAAVRLADEAHLRGDAGFGERKRHLESNRGS
jgi:hypothetical protein